MKQREEERVKREKEEEAIRQREAEEARLAAGMSFFVFCFVFLLTKMVERLAEEDRLRAEEEAALAAAAEAKRKEEAELTARREARERERQEANEKARLQQQREEEALARREARAAEKLAASRKPVAAPTAVPASVRAAAVGKEDNLWRRSTPVPSHAATATAPPAPLRSESPAPKYRPGALSAAGGGGGGGWRQREEAAKAAGGAGGRPGPIPPRVTASPRPNSPAPLKDEPKKDDDGFQTVPTRGGGGAGDRGGVWRPNRGGRA